MAVQSELMQLTPALQLSPQQQQQVSAILLQQQQQPHPIAQQPGSPLNYEAIVDQQMDAKKNAVRAVLTPEQQQVYDKFIENQREQTKSVMSMMGGAKDQTPAR